VFRPIRSCLTLIGLLVVAAVVVFLYRTASQPSANSSQPASAPAPAAAAGAPAAAVDARFASAEAAIRQNAAQGKHAPVPAFVITDAEMTARVNEAVNRGEVQAPVSNVTVNTVPGQVNIKGQAKASVLAVPFTMAAVPRVAGGKAQLQVTGVDFGGVPVPGPLASQLTSAVGSDNLLGDLPLTVTSFRAEQGRLVLEGTT
jgi:uncharacterized protein YpmS